MLIYCVGGNKLDDRRLSWFISAVILFLFIDNLLACLEGTFGISAETISVLLKGILGVIFVTELPIIIKKIITKIKLLIFCFITAFTITSNFLFFPDISVYFSDTVMTFLTVCFTVYLAMGLICNYDILFENLLITAYIISALACVLLITSFTGRISGFNGDKYSMGFGYSCLLPILLLIYNFYKNRSVKDIFSIIILLLAVLSFGSRGPLIGIALFVGYLLCRYVIKTRNFLIAIALAAVFVFFILYYDNLILWLNNLLSNVGINSRTLTMMLSGDLNSTRSRDALYETIRESINSQPFKIRGINAEWIVIGVYAHNLFLELMYQLGWLGGISYIYILVCCKNTVISNRIRQKVDTGYFYVCSVACIDG